jgi:hypothetical protein
MKMASDKLPWRILEKYGYNLVYPKSERLFHYTTARGLKGILESRKLWASDARCLNDSTEVDLGVQLGSEIAKETRLFSDLAIGDIFEATFQSCAAFIISFSELRDDLSQWRGYGADGRGYCLGFDLEGYTADMKYTRGYWPLIGPVMYEQDTARKIMNELATAYIEEQIKPRSRKYKETHDEAEKNKAEYQLRQAIYDMVSYLCSLDALTKDKAFVGEKEVRLAQVCPYDCRELGKLTGDQDSSDEQAPRFLVKVRDDGAEGFTPYIDFDFKKHETVLEWLKRDVAGQPEPTSLCLAEIILPPQTWPHDRAKNGVVALLRQYGYDPESIEISSSSVSSYRT